MIEMPALSELVVPRGTATAPSACSSCPKEARRLGGLDEMIISVYASGMTLRDIQHHLALTTSTELSMRRAPNHGSGCRAGGGLAAATLVAVVSGDYCGASVVKVRGGAHGRNKARQIAVDLAKDVVGSNQVGPPSRRQPQVFPSGVPYVRCRI